MFEGVNELMLVLSQDDSAPSAAGYRILGSKIVALKAFGELYTHICSTVTC